MTETREWRRSEARRLQPRRCQKCQGTEMPSWTDSSGVYDDEPDPQVVVSYRCTNELCDNASPF